MTIDDSESEDENHLVGNRYNNDDSDTDSEIDFYNLPSVGTKRLVLLQSCINGRPTHRLATCMNLLVFKSFSL